MTQDAWVLLVTFSLCAVLLVALLVDVRRARKRRAEEELE